MPRSIFEQTLYEMIVVRKNLTNTNLSLDEGKIEGMRERENESDGYIYTEKKRKTKSFQFTIDMMIKQSKYSIFFSLSFKCVNNIIFIICFLLFDR